MGKSRVIDDFSVKTTGTGECADCGEDFPIVLYEGEACGQAFARCHPRNGCWVTEHVTVATTTTRSES